MLYTPFFALSARPHLCCNALRLIVPDLTAGPSSCTADCLARLLICSLGFCLEFCLSLASRSIGLPIRSFSWIPFSACVMHVAMPVPPVVNALFFSRHACAVAAHAFSPRASLPPFPRAPTAITIFVSPARPTDFRLPNPVMQSGQNAS